MLLDVLHCCNLGLELGVVYRLPLETHNPELWTHIIRCSSIIYHIRP